MISRLWHGWTTRDNADAYEELLRSEILPGIHRVAGFKGALVLRRDGKDEVEFVTLTMFDSMAAVAITPIGWTARRWRKRYHLEAVLSVEFPAVPSR